MRALVAVDGDVIPETALCDVHYADRRWTSFARSEAAASGRWDSSVPFRAVDDETLSCLVCPPREPA